MKGWRRYEILLPRRYNDGKPVPKVLLAQAVSELEEQFGAISVETQVIKGRWRGEGRVFHDELMRIWVDVKPTRETDAFLLAFKEQAKSRFQQLEIWISSHSIEIL